MEKQEYKSASQCVREAVKALGYNNKQVSVRNDGGSVNVSIKDISVDFDAVKNAAQSFERVSRCEYSQEILCGGNTFVSVRYDWEVERDLKKSDDFKKLLESVEAKLVDLESGKGVEIVPGLWAFKSFNNGWHCEIDGEHQNFYGIADLVFAVYVEKAQKKLN